jgi:hypothetical protein
MRNARRKTLSAILVISMLAVTTTFIPDVLQLSLFSSRSESTNDSRKIVESPAPIQKSQGVQRESDPSILSSDTSADGILSPVTVEQSGYAASGNISARTDSYKNLQYNLPLDVSHNWTADEAETSVWNLQKLYAINGTFSQGFAGTNVNPNNTNPSVYYPLGWYANSTDTKTYPDDLQLAGYDSSGSQYVYAESQGGKVGQKAFGHATGTRIVWSQNVQNTPYTEDFILNFDYFYLRGPLDLNPSVPIPITGNCSITVSIDGSTIWNMSLLTLSQRGIWQNTNDILIHIPGAPESFVFEIGLKIDKLLELDIRYDYDNNGIADGIANAAYITVFLDDVSFIKTTPPTAEQVDLEFTAEGFSSALSGSMGTYYASIQNPSSWNSTPVSISMTSNTSISFDYKTRLHSHRFTDSSWRTDVSSHGVAYTIDYGLSSSLIYYAYVGYLGNYEDPYMIIRYPIDWENLTVSDPFLFDYTAHCIIDTGYVYVPTSIINSLGWWQFQLNSPNYAKSIKPQIRDATWRDETMFWIGNTTRADITIGTESQTLGYLTDVNVTWIKPSNVVWLSNLTSGGSLGQIYSDDHTFESGSSPAGEWSAEVYWQNGSEVAYDKTTLEVHHTTNLVADPSSISTDTGLSITGIVRYTDADTGASILNPSAVIVANWSIVPISFVPNTIHGWWEGSFDTSLLSEGKFAIIVNASMQYYANASCQITLQSIRATRLNSPNAPWTADGWGHITVLTFNYESYYYNTASWEPITNDTGVSMSMNWTAGFWSVEEDATPGIYKASLDTSVRNSGTWLLNTTFTKPNYQTKTVFLTLIVSPATSSLSIFGDVSARVNLDEEQSVKLTYRNSGGLPISGANVVVDRIYPSTGISYTTIEEVGGEPGNYSASFTPHVAGVFTIRFFANETNSEPAITVFVLVVNDVATFLDISGPASVEIGLTDVYNTTFRFAMLNGTGISNAQINITYSGGTPDALLYTLAEQGMGDYSVEFNSTSSGTYVVTIAAFKQYYQSSSDSFFLMISGINTTLSSLNGSADVVGFGHSYKLVVNYTVTNTGVGLPGAQVTIVNIVPATGLSCNSSVYESAGLYSISMIPLVANTFTVLIRADLANYESRFTYFTLTGSATPTTLTVLNASATIPLDQTFTAYLQYQDEELQGLDSADLIIQSAPEGVSFSAFQSLGDGLYRVTIMPIEAGTFDIVFKASKTGYQSDYGSFTLGATRISTSLHVASGLSSDTVMFSQQYPLLLRLERIDSHLNVTGANINIQSSPETGFNFSYSESNGGYLLLLETARTGRWTLTITAEKANHTSSSIEFILDVTPIPIDITVLSEYSAVEGQTLNVVIRLTQHNTSIPITNAAVTYRITSSRTGEFSLMVATGEDGVYTGQFTPPLYTSDTQYYLEIKVEKDNYIYEPGIFERPITKSVDIILRIMPVAFGGGGIFVAILALLVMMRVSTKRKKKQLANDLVNKRRFDDADNIIGVIILHKRSGIPIYSKMMKGGFEEGIVAAFITAVTHFREEFEMFDEESMAVIPISDIIRAVQTRNLICAVITVKSASVEHNRNMEEYARQIAKFLDDLLDGKPDGIIDKKIADMLDYIFNTTMDGFLLQYYKVATSERFPKRYQLLDEILQDTETRHCTKPVLLAKSLTSFGLTEARACTAVLEAIEKELIVLCNEEETEALEFKFSDFFAQPDRPDGSHE